MLLRRLISVACCAAALTLAAVPAEAASAIQFRKIQYNSPGSDSGSNTSLNAEYVTIKNTGTTTRTMTSWTLRDASNHVYTFGTFKLGAGKSVAVHTGKGTNSSTNLYWGLAGYVWNNGSDQAILRSSIGTGIDTCTWTTAGAGYKNC